MNRIAINSAWAGLAVLPLVGAALTEAAPVPAAKLRYNRDVRPILADNCFACHGPDSAARKAGLRLDNFAAATASANGRAAIVPGKPDQSELFNRVLGHGPLMPPAATKKKLTPQQIATLKNWIAQGAQYEKHWAYLPPVRVAPPAVKNIKWVRNPIDRFILAKIEEKGLQPAPEADRRTLARRLSLDLTGLPPAPADVEAFVNDKAPNAYEKLVDKFMAMPQWGEHRGRYWLDVARYADTHGIHFDNYRENWAYRDWVIKAFNKNQPFDQFSTEQLAGDLMPNPTLDQIVATGFNRCNITTNEGGAISEEYLVLYNRDRTETFGQTWLATTVGCGVCHDHKFDPLTQKEFYSLAAFFNNTTQNAMDGNIKDTPPVIAVPMEEDRPRFETIKTEIADVRKQVEERKNTARGDFDKWAGAANPTQAMGSIPSEGLRFHLPLNEGQGRDVKGTLDGQAFSASANVDPAWRGGNVADKAFQRKGGSVVSIPNAGDFEKDQGFTVSTWVNLPANTQPGSILGRMDQNNDYRGWDLWIEGNRLASHIINKWPENAMKIVSRQQLQPGKWHHVAMTYTGAGNASGMRLYIDGRAVDTDANPNSLNGTIRTTVPFTLGQRNMGQGIEGIGLQDVRMYNRALSMDEVAGVMGGSRAAYLASRGMGQLNAAEKDELFSWWLNGQDQQYRTLSTKAAALENEERTIRLRGTTAFVSQEKREEAMAYILFRGEYDRRKDPVKPTTPEVLPAMPADAPKNRLGLARWLFQPQHPLTARVTVNRFWQEVFGTGIVKTSGDFGVSGELPTHPELLDWLSLEFRDGGWDVKKFFKLLVTSATYRQAAIATPEKKAKDPANRLLSRGPRFRMDAEMVRDYALATSGLLVKKQGGPSVRPYQPEGVWEAVAMIGSNTRDYVRDKGENLYRRSMYTFWKRAAPPASMEVFNAPNRETCAVRRERTNTPLQALVTLNDVQFIEAARNLAQHALKEAGTTTSARMDYLTLRLMSRKLNPTEAAIAAKNAAELEAHYKSHLDDAKALIAEGDSKADASVDPALLAAWTMVANQLMNLDEVLNK